jgi:tetratricopeptide (TPR) repeat protein
VRELLRRLFRAALSKNELQSVRLSHIKGLATKPSTRNVEVAHKSKLRGTITPSTPLPERIGRARKEGRFQQALELTRQFYKQDPTEESLALLRQVSFERGEQLQSQGYLKEAAQTFSNILDMGGPPELKRKLIDKLAACGAVAPAMNLAEQLGDTQVRANLTGVAADLAVRKGDRSLVSVDAQPQFDAVVQAFAQAEAGKDEEARATLQVIGLSSPFMEWRILLRGLLAYYANDDARALENWQRLNPQRLPARLAAPLRFGIDESYRAAQPPSTQTALRQQLDRLQGSGTVPGLRTIQAQLTQKDKLGQAFRHIEGLLPTLRQQAPHLIPRLAACFRWSVIDVGQEEDIDRFLRVFGAPADDRQLHRMTALALEKNSLYLDAHQRWQLFEKEVADNNPAWPGDLSRHVRALVWAHIGQLAVDHAIDTTDGEIFLPFLPHPSAKKHKYEECLRKSLELAPESLPTHMALVECLMDNPDKEPAIGAAKKLLEYFPEHVETMQLLVSLYMNDDRIDEAGEYLRRALAVNPLQKELRLQLCKIEMLRARAFSRCKRYDEARTACEAAAAVCDLPVRYPLNCLRAIIELKAKNRQIANDLVGESLKDAGHRLLVVYCLLRESIVQKLAAAQKKLFVQEFDGFMDEEVDPVAIPPLLSLLRMHAAGEKPYTGQKSHVNKILAVVDRTCLKSYSEEILETVCENLLELEATKRLVRCLQYARETFPHNPVFILCEAESLIPRRGTYKAEKLLKKARKIIDGLPRGDRHQILLDKLQQLEQQLRDLDGLRGLMSMMMDRFRFGDDEDDDY